MEELYLDVADRVPEYSPSNKAHFKSEAQWVWLESSIAVIAFGEQRIRQFQKRINMPLAFLASLDYIADGHTEDEFRGKLIDIIATIETCSNANRIEISECYISGMPNTSGYRKSFEIACDVADDSELEFRTHRIKTNKPCYTIVDPREKALVCAARLNWDSIYRKYRLRLR